jgi:hypothetical protein
MSFLDYSLSGVSSAAVCSLELQRDSKEMENSFLKGLKFASFLDTELP